MVVRCYDLVPARSKRWTRKMDDFLRAHYFSGLAVAQITDYLRQEFHPPWIRNKSGEQTVKNRLIELKIYKKNSL